MSVTNPETHLKPVVMKALPTAGIIFFVLLVLLPAAVRFLPFDLSIFPEAWNFGIREPIDAFQKWVVVNRADSPAFTWFFNPIKDAINDSVKFLEDVANFNIVFGS